MKVIKIYLPDKTEISINYFDIESITEHWALGEGDKCCWTVNHKDGMRAETYFNVDRVDYVKETND